MEIEIKKQRQLTFRETLEFCSSSIRHRFSRSLLTLAVMVLAVAFFMYLQADNIFRDTIRRDVTNEIAANRRSSLLLTMLFARYSEKEFQKLLLQISSGSDRYDKRFCAVFGWNEARFKRFLEHTHTALVMEEFLKSLSSGKYHVLFGNTPEEKLLEYWHTSGTEGLVQKFRQLGTRLPVEPKALKDFFAAYPDYLRDLKKVGSSWSVFQQRLRAFDRSIGNDMRQIRHSLSSLNSSQDEALRNLLRKEKFAMEPTEWKEIVDYLHVQNAAERLSRHLALPDIRKRWRAKFGRDRYISQDEKFSIIDSAECKEFTGDLTPDEVGKVAEDIRRKLKYNILEQKLGLRLSEFSKQDRSLQVYLMALAFLVCIIGITNAMLMSITERFTEIATLKCLGATDFFILFQIVLEAMIQGICGGILGVLLGLAAAGASNLYESGFRIFTRFEFTELGTASLISVAAGVILAMLSAIYPAIKAGRMAPMEAMRVQ